MDARAELEAIGVAPDTARVLATPPRPGVLDDGEAPRTREQVVLHAALVAALDPRTHADALRTTTGWLEEHLADLDSYDRARFWHVRGIVAWRLDGEELVAIRAFNAAMRLLFADTAARTLAYRARVHDTLGQLLHHHSLLGDARYELECALALRQGDADLAGLAITLGNLGRLCMDLGDFTAAATYLAQDLAIVEDTTPEAKHVRAQLCSHLASCALATRDIDAAERWLRTSELLAREAGDQLALAYAALGFGRARLVRGDATGAFTAAKDVIAGLDALDVRAPFRAAVEAIARRLAGDAQLALGRPDEALASYMHARSRLAVAAGTSPIERAEIECGLAAAYLATQATGAPAKAARSLREALRHLDMTAAGELRREVETELQRVSYDAWLLHSAGRFMGQVQIETRLAEAGREGFRGARRRAIVLFSDLRGFTTLSERLGAEALIALLNDYLTVMTRCVDRHGGSVDKFIGDAVMAVFDGGAGTSAIACALAMHDELERFTRRVGATLSAGIGLHAGEVVGGLIGSAQKREPTVIGDVVNTASRIEGMTKQLGATTLVTDAVLDNADRARFLVRPVGRYAPKGKRGGVGVFDVMGLRDRTPESAAALREIEACEAAITRFTARDFTGAAPAFDALARDAGEPRATGYALLARKAREMVACAPGADWSGEIVLVDK